MSRGNNRIPTEALSTGRLETLVDGVFAIVLTLLVFDLRAPQAATNHELLNQLVALWPAFASFVISFAILGIFWFGHRMESHWIVRSDRIHIWITLLLLICIAFVPFSASLLGKNMKERLALMIYGANMVLASTMRCVHWCYATSRHRLVRVEMDPQLIRSVRRRFVAVPLLYLMAIGVSLLNFTAATLVLYAAVPVLYILPAAQSRHLTSLAPPDVGAATMAPDE